MIVFRQRFMDPAAYTMGHHQVGGNFSARLSTQ